MKKILFLSLIISLIIGSCAQQEKKSPIEGTWKMVYGDWSSYNIKDTYPAQVKGGQIKLYTKSYFSYVGEFKLDNTESMNTGCGTYTS